MIDSKTMATKSRIAKDKNGEELRRREKLELDAEEDTEATADDNNDEQEQGDDEEDNDGDDDDDDEYDDDYEDEDYDEEDDDDYYNSDELETGLSFNPNEDYGEDEDDDDDEEGEDEDEDEFISEIETEDSKKTEKLVKREETGENQSSSLRKRKRKRRNKAGATNSNNKLKRSVEEKERDENNHSIEDGKRQRSSKKKQVNQTINNNPATHYNTVNDSWFINYNGIIVILPIIFNAFQDKKLEKSYQRYSHGQRQKSLIIAHTLDLLLKICLLIVPLMNVDKRVSFINTSYNNQSSIILENLLVNQTYLEQHQLQTTSDKNSPTMLLHRNARNQSRVLINNLEMSNYLNISDNQMGDKSIERRKLDVDFIINNDLIEKTEITKSKNSAVNSGRKNVRLDSGKQSNLNYTYHEEQLRQLSEKLMFGPLTDSLKQNEPFLMFRESGNNNNNESKSDSNAFFSKINLNLIQKLLLENLKIYDLPLTFCALNVLIISVCICVPHRYLTNRLSFIALMTWFLMCLQNNLIYSNMNNDKEATLSTISSSNEGLATIVSLNIVVFSNSILVL